MDAGKSFLGIGGSNKYAAAKGFLGESTSEIPKLGQAIAKSLGNVKTTVVSAAQGIFSGSGGLASVFQEGFGGVASIAQKAIGGLGSIFGNISTTLGGTKLFSGIAGIFKGIGTTVKAAIGTAGGTGVAGTIAAAVSHIPVIGTILLGGTLAVGAIGGGSFTNGLAKIGSTIGKAVTGIGKTLGKIVKSIGKTITKAISGIGKFLFGGTSSDGTKKRGVLGTIVHVVTAPIRWLFGKRAKGDKSIKKSGTYNVDEEGEEIIVRSPEKGRLTQLEKGDGVIPAKQTATLMGIAKNPIGWVKNVASKIPSSRDSAASSGYTTITSAPQTRKNTAIDSKVDEVVEAVDDIRDDNKTGLIPTLLSKSVKTLSGLNLKFTTFTDKTKSTINSSGQSSSVSKWFDKIQKSGKYNVDEQGSELLVRQPQAGRYTYLETGDGVVPADITSRLFEMGGNPDAWFQDQMSKYGTTSLSSNGGSNIDISIGDIVIQNPVGGAEDLANEIVRNLPNKLSQKMNKRN